MAKKKKSNVIKMDFRETGGSKGGTRFAEGDYPAKIIGVKKGKSENKGTPFIEVEFEVTAEGKYEGKKIRDRMYLSPAAAWRIRNMLEAAGKSIPEKLVNVDISKWIDLELAITITDGEPKEKDGKEKIYSEVSDWLDLDVLGDDDAEEDEDEDDDEDESDDDDDSDEDEDDDDEDDDDLEEVDLDEL